MEPKTLLRLGLAALLVGSACNSPAPVTVPAARPVPHSFVAADGEVDYPALRRVFGAPNKNIVLNPRSVDVGLTPSKASVKIGSTRLEFKAADAGWLLKRRSGDTLYCSHVCGGTGFLRRIQSVKQTGDTIVVTTAAGALTDVVHSGWLHAEVPVHLETPEASRHFNHDSYSEVSVGDYGVEDLSGSLSGKITAHPSFTTKIVADVAISAHLSLSNPVTVDLFKIVVTGTPSLDLDAQMVATGSFSGDWTFFEKEFPLGGFPLGPVEVTPAVVLDLSGGVEAEGATTVQAHASISESVSAGFIYTSAGGAQLVDQSSFSHSQSYSMTGNSDVKIMVSLTASLAFKIYDLAGPQIVLDADVGAQGKADLSSQSGPSGQQCAAALEGSFFFHVEGGVGVVLGFKNFGYEKNFTLAQHTWNFPDPGWKYQVPTDKLNTCLGLGSDGCPQGQKKCGGTCADLTSDGENCGACGTICPDATGDQSSTCSAKVCSCSCADGSACPDGKSTRNCPCPDGQQDCGSGCQDVTGDAANCGKCGATCTDATGDANSTCSASQCSCTCPDGSACTGADTSSCATTCLCDDGTTVCPDGDSTQCPCPDGQQDCGGGDGCQDIAGDALNCGACGTICSEATGDQSSECSAQQCSCTCDDGSSCPGSDTSSCASSCLCADGTTPCPDGDSSQCTCPDGQDDCGTGLGCQDLTSDASNCGQCGTSCPDTTGDPNSQCSAEQCSCSCADGSDCPDGASTASCACPDGQQDCGSGCQDVTGDAQNCGDCNNDCWSQTGDPNSTCSGSTCSCSCPDGSDCPGADTSTCCACADGSTCPSGDASQCPCADGSADCGNGCQDVTGDAQNCGSCGYVCADNTGDSNSQCYNSACTCSCPDDSDCPGADTSSCPDSSGGARWRKAPVQRVPAKGSVRNYRPPR